MDTFREMEIALYLGMNMWLTQYYKHVRRFGNTRYMEFTSLYILLCCVHVYVHFLFVWDSIFLGCPEIHCVAKDSL